MTIDVMPGSQFRIGTLMLAVALAAAVLAAGRLSPLASLFVVSAGQIAVYAVMYGKLRHQCWRERREPTPEERTEADDRSRRLCLVILMPSLVTWLVCVFLPWPV